jgi:tetratricopeptide (TPR) repeat protein
MRSARETGELVMLGVIQEQHAERCRLFAQWHKFDWPILHDPINTLGLRGVPIVVELDEHGITKSINPSVDSILASFSGKKRPTVTEASQAEQKKPDITALRRTAQTQDTYSAWTNLGDAPVLWGDDGSAARAAIEAYTKAKQREPDNSEVYFRLGVAHRMQYDLSPDLRSRSRPINVPATPISGFGVFPSRETNQQANHFQAAVDNWGKALELEPNHYIYRRRIQQYGPRLTKPYPFYDWVERARREIALRGDVPLKLEVEPSGAEIAAPARQFPATLEERAAPDPHGKIQRDTQGLVRSEVVVVPASVRPGEAVRVYIELEPAADANWNNEGDPLVLWVELTDGWQAERQWMELTLPESAESTERRCFEFEVKPAASQTTSTTLEAYALYYVCESTRGACLYLRQDVKIPINISERHSP